MNLLEKIFSEKSDISVMRIMSVFSLLLGACLALAGRDASIVSIFVFSAFTGKAAQRYIETKDQPVPSESDDVHNP